MSRARYEERGVDGRHPADAELELPTGLYSHEVTRLLTQQAAQVSFERAIDFVAQTTGVAVPKRQAEELVRNAAQDFEGFGCGSFGTTFTRPASGAATSRVGHEVQASRRCPSGRVRDEAA